ncbi:hypothetical protein DMB42_11855 [Nonomuraea sp. WAC 01424]|uniref:phage antirepressor N-terminal domain-containing protein n=1 Tax=Nonomuraea sp. WAC 01424 TaxID=2203200 RepID=UPI000F77CFC9|nr:phage antirepressor N-terminal domain-containing protein [Nonomuraea sp. WAC 01424]RSN12865.1 hypothetical protein DMB42_11855 [Nonomuraea sp. WAC 01424]
MSDIVHIPFHGGEILAAQENGKPRIILKPAVEHIGLDYPTQYRKLESKSWATVGLVPMVAEDGRTRQMVVVDLRTFLMLLATIDEKRVSDAARPILVAYQNEVADVIEAYFTKGSVANPRLAQAELAPMAISFDDAMALYGQEYGYDYPTPFFTAGLRLAGFLRQGGCVPRRKKRKYFWFNGTSWEIRAWALPILFGEFDNVIRQFEPLPWAQLRLDDGAAERVLPVKRGES